MTGGEREGLENICKTLRESLCSAIVKEARGGREAEGSRKRGQWCRGGWGRWCRPFTPSSSQLSWRWGAERLTWGVGKGRCPSTHMHIGIGADLVVSGEERERRGGEERSWGRRQGQQGRLIFGIHFDTSVQQLKVDQPVCLDPWQCLFYTLWRVTSHTNQMWEGCLFHAII